MSSLSIYIYTRKLPGLAFVEINFSNGSATEMAVQNLLEKVISDELFVCGVESEPRRQTTIVVVKVLEISPH